MCTNGEMDGMGVEADRLTLAGVMCGESVLHVVKGCGVVDGGGAVGSIPEEIPIQ